MPCKSRFMPWKKQVCAVSKIVPWPLWATVLSRYPRKQISIVTQQGNTQIDVLKCISSPAMAHVKLRPGHREF